MSPEMHDGAVLINTITGLDAGGAAADVREVHSHLLGGQAVKDWPVRGVGFAVDEGVAGVGDGGFGSNGDSGDAAGHLYGVTLAMDGIRLDDATGDLLDGLKVTVEGVTAARGVIAGVCLVAGVVSGVGGGDEDDGG